MNESLTDEQKNEYVKHPYACPFCGSENLLSKDFVPRERCIPVVCLDCEKGFNEEYSLTGICEQL